MKVRTTRFGDLEIAEEFVYTFPEGLPGFDGKQYVIIQNEDNPVVQWLQSTHDPGIALMMMDPLLLEPRYAYNPRPNELAPIRSETVDSGVECRVIVRRGDREGELYANLFAPVLFNVGERRAMQLPLVGSQWGVREVWPRPEQKA